MPALSDALAELKSRPPRSAFARLSGSETGTRIVWAGSRFEMENSKGEGVTWCLAPDDVLSEWVVLEAAKQPEFVAGGPASRTGGDQ
jgi:hypothetical protein